MNEQTKELQSMEDWKMYEKVKSEGVLYITMLVSFT